MSFFNHIVNMIVPQKLNFLEIACNFNFFSSDKLYNMVETKITRISNECSFVCTCALSILITHYSYCKVAYFKPLSSSTFVLVHFKRFFFIAIFLLINIWVLLLIFFNKSKKVLVLGENLFFCIKYRQKMKEIVGFHFEKIHQKMQSSCT